MLFFVLFIWMLISTWACYYYFFLRRFNSIPWNIFQSPFMLIKIIDFVCFILVVADFAADLLESFVSLEYIECVFMYRINIFILMIFLFSCLKMTDFIFTFYHWYISLDFFYSIYCSMTIIFVKTREVKFPSNLINATVSRF